MLLARGAASIGAFEAGINSVPHRLSSHSDHIVKSRIIWTAFAATLFALLLVACGGPAPVTPIPLTGGQFTPLGRVQKNNQPTSSDTADLQATESGRLQLPALVEFYADF
jgi:hypothetical protein